MKKTIFIIIIILAVQLFSDTILLGNWNGNIHEAVPINPTYRRGVSQIIYPKTDISSAMLIDKIELQYASTEFVYRYVDILINEDTKNEFINDEDWLYNDPDDYDYFLAFRGYLYFEPCEIQGNEVFPKQLTIELDNPFLYKNKENLVITFKDDYYSSTLNPDYFAFACNSTNKNRTLTYADNYLLWYPDNFDMLSSPAHTEEYYPTLILHGESHNPLVQIGEGDIGKDLPFGGDDFNKYSQIIYDYDEFGRTPYNRSLDIESIWLDLKSVYYGSATVENVEIYFCSISSTKTKFTNGNDWIDESHFTKVYEGDLTFQQGTNWYEIELDEIFNYYPRRYAHGHPYLSNLVIAFKVSTGNGYGDNISFNNHYTWREAKTLSKWGYQSNQNPTDLQGVRKYYRPNILFEGNFSSSRDGEESNIPIEMVTPLLNSLSQNYPNPFNPTTTISYQLEKESDVNLTIFNVKGQKVTQLVNELKSTGTHSVIWNGIDEKGNSVPSGVYFYRIEAGEFLKTKCMMLMK